VIKATWATVSLLVLALPGHSLAVERQATDLSRSGLVSKVGRVSSYVDSYESDAGAHPSYGCRLNSTYQQAATFGGRPVERTAVITDLFDEADVFVALVHAWPVIDALGDSRPSNLTELLAHLKPTCEVAWDQLPNAFAVMAVVERGASAVVRFGLGYGCEAARGSNTEFDVVIRIRGDQVAAFRTAVARKNLGRARTCGGTHEWSCCLRWMK